MNLMLLGILAVLGILAGTWCLLEVGRRFGARQLAQDPEGAKSGTGAIEAAVFGLMGLLIAFTFSGAASRFDARRTQIVDEANCIGTAWLRLDLLPAGVQPSMREKFRQYVDARLAVFQKLPDIEAAQAELARSATVQNEIWKQAVDSCRDTGSPSTTMLLLPAFYQLADRWFGSGWRARHPEPEEVP